MYGKCVIKKVECLSSEQGKITRQDKAQVICGLRNKFSVKELLQLANISRSTYYYWIKQFNRSDPNADVKELIQAIYNKHDGY
ncbi:hypothetical protein TU66_30245 [Bacillus cereus]|nr:hypothetical protein C621_0220015 [Bacillus thuringiensis serovar aizawai str. Leapi01]ETE99375.1 hypothetical protein C623_0204465 [Bacillus thuringiensis serovar aizawai str. Hu4-2]KMP97400.1 hypothetical protein TU66_30245 [Bacillus cereus]OIX16768.1 hypothetical protein BMT18_26345 [Bacillus thuringiensis serovar aizawai]